MIFFNRRSPSRADDAAVSGLPVPPAPSGADDPVLMARQLGRSGVELTAGIADGLVAAIIAQLNAEDERRRGDDAGHAAEHQHRRLRLAQSSLNPPSC